jgi:hypothetical protein
MSIAGVAQWQSSCLVSSSARVRVHAAGTSSYLRVCQEVWQHLVVLRACCIAFRYCHAIQKASEAEPLFDLGAGGVNPALASLRRFVEGAFHATVAPSGRAAG